MDTSNLNLTIEQVESMSESKGVIIGRCVASWILHKNNQNGECNHNLAFEDRCMKCGAWVN